MATYCAGKKCTHLITSLRTSDGNLVGLEVGKKHDSQKEIDDWVQKWREKNPNVEDEDDALIAYSKKYIKEGTPSEPIKIFLEKFCDVFPRTKRGTHFIEMDDNIWKAIAEKPNAGKKATEADQKEFEEYIKAYKEDPVKFIKDNFKLKK